MAAITRTRPWQLAALARLDFAPALNNTTTRGLLAHRQQTRHAASKSRRLPPTLRVAMRQAQISSEYQECSTSMMENRSRETHAVSPAETAVLAPRTLVPLPLHKTFHLKWAQWMTYWKEIAMQRLSDRLGLAQQAWRLKTGKWYQRATFRAPRDGIIVTAIELHAEMSRCLAVGGAFEKKRLAEICVPKLHRSLVAAVESRPRGRSYIWERVSLVRSGLRRWPRLVDHKWFDMDMGFMQSQRQAVVGIRSKQRLTELNAKGEKVGTKEMDVTEYVVLWKSVDKEKMVQGDWLIYGTLKEMSLEEILDEKDMMTNLADATVVEKLQQRKLGEK